MNAFDAAKMVEAQAMTRLLPFIEEQSEGHFVVTDKGRLAPLLQQMVGDVIFNSRTNGHVYAVEIKAEREWTGNLFLETWSNRNLEDRASRALRGMNPGWLCKLRADLLFYYFLDVDRLLVLDVFALQRWAFGGGKREPSIYRYREARQRRFDQANDTWGRIVPWTVLRVELEVQPRQYSVSQLALSLGSDMP